MPICCLFLKWEIGSCHVYLVYHKTADCNIAPCHSLRFSSYGSFPLNCKAGIIFFVSMRLH
jgi:hypothetical protein